MNVGDWLMVLFVVVVFAVFELAIMRAADSNFRRGRGKDRAS